MVREKLIVRIVRIAIRIEGGKLVPNLCAANDGRPHKEITRQQCRTWIIRRRETRTGICDVIAKESNQKKSAAANSS
jgi:hypothetical protein